MLRFRLLLLTLLSTLCTPLHAVDIPEPLQPWRDWVLNDHPDHACPHLATQPAQRHCVWPGRLTLAVSGEGARFSQHWQLAAPGWVVLPGERDHWPSEVSVGGRPAAVLDRDGKPALQLPAGDHAVAGRLQWGAPPQSLPVPAETVLLTLSIDGEAVAWPRREGERVWLQTRESPTAVSADAVEAQVFRRLDDDIPRRLETVLRLSVSGAARELRLGRLLLTDNVVEQFESPLPARIEEDGSLRLQVRPGQWQLRLRSRIEGDRNRFAIAPDQGHWPAQEIWSFAARPELRRVAVSGAASLDPGQLDLPAGFGGLPTYLMEASTELRLEEQLRGDAAPAADELSLARTVWLDFKGEGATVRDRIRGTLQRSWRLEAQPALQLGRVSVNGEPQVVTRREADGPAGIELRQRQVDIEAISRLDPLHGLDAVGWQHDFDSVSWTLQLPPGWKLWHVSGPDSVQRSWLSQWDLWDIFLALLLVGASYRLLGWSVAGVATAAVLLVWHEPASPLLWLLPLLALVGLLRWLPANAARRWLLRAGALVSLGLIIALLGFAVEQARRVIYPQLEQPLALAGPDRAQEAAFRARAAAEASLAERAVSSDRAMKRLSAAAPVAKAPPRPQRYQPAANVQTGPGVPAWSWQQVALQWSGPVQAGQPLRLVTSGPWLTRLLSMAGVLLAAWLAVAVLRRLWQLRHPGAGGPEGAAGAGSARQQPLASAGLPLMLLTMAMATPPTSVEAADYPPPELLQQLQERLLQVPECAPTCASIESALVELAGDNLRLRLRVGVGAPLALPLPSSPQWQLRSLRVDDSAADSLRQEQGPLLPLAPGRHELLLEGPVAGDSVTLQFPLPAHNVTVRADGWEVAGLAGARLAASSLQLQRQQRGENRDTLLPATPPPFVEVRRELQFDLDWQVVTRVVRVAPAQGAIALRVPLLPGESVVSDGIAVRDGLVSVNLGARDSALQWRSVLPRSNSLTLTAGEGAWAEQWSLRAAPRWHVESSGLVPVRLGDSDERLNWRPWPGESLVLALRQPQPVQGANTTVEAATLSLVPGARGAEAVLALSVTSSVGGDFPVTLAEAGELRSLRLNGDDIALAGGAAEVALPLVPGDNQAQIRWQLPRGVETVTRSPELTLGVGAANLTLIMELPRDRWPLWVSGPRIGPAMLFWGVLLVIVALALGLGTLVRRQRLSIPLGPLQWLLLAVGMSTVSAAGSLLVVLWFFALEGRRRMAMPASRLRFNLIQLGLALLSLLALATLLAVIPESLLAAPDMQVTGNGSHNYFYQWYQDRSGETLPRALVVSVSLWFYRLAMLAWSLWLVFALLRWIAWGWRSYGEGGLWRRPAPKPVPSSNPIDSEENR